MTLFLFCLNFKRYATRCQHDNTKKIEDVYIQVSLYFLVTLLAIGYFQLRLPHPGVNDVSHQVSVVKEQATDAMTTTIGATIKTKDQ